MADPQKTRWEQMLETEKDRWLGPAWEQLRKEPWVEYVPVNELLPLREYHWSEDYNRHGRDEFLDMIEDMKRHGVREPITIRYFPDTKRAKIIEGNHRLAAAIKAGLKEVPARVTIASYPQSEYGKNSYADNQEGGPVRGRLTDERPYSDYIKPSDIGLSGKKTPTQKLGAASPELKAWPDRFTPDEVARVFAQKYPKYKQIDNNWNPKFQMQTSSAQITAVSPFTEKEVEGWAKYYQSYGFTTEQELRDWFFERLEWEDQQSWASLFGKKGTEKNRQIADTIPVHREGRKFKIGPKPKKEPVSTERLGTSEPPSRNVPSVDWYKGDLQDGKTRVTEEDILREYNYSRRGNPPVATVYPAWVEFSELPEPRLAGGLNYDWEQFGMGRQAFPPAKIIVSRTGKVTIADGNHRVYWWKERGYDAAPCWVIDQRGGIVMTASVMAPELKTWLGNSKIKSIVWHGSKAKFDTFQYMPSKRYVLFSEFDVTAHGFFFSPSKEGAAEYGTPRPYYIKLTKPLVTLQEAQRQERFPDKREKQLAYIFEPLLTEYQDYQGRTRRQIEVGVRAWTIDESDYSWIWYAIGSNGVAWDALDNPEVVARMKSCGYDGTWVDERDMEDGYSIFVVSPNQIKSADQNSGKYDPNDARVTASHKQTPLSDTTFEDISMSPNGPMSGEGTNGYTTQPEKVEGTYDLPSLEELGVKTAAPKYLSGYCHAYTVALHKLTGYPCYFISDAEYGEGVLHSCVKAPNGKFIDYSGETTLEQMGKYYGLVKPVAKPATVKQVCDMGVLDDCEDDFEVEEAMQVAKRRLGKTASELGQVYLLHFDKPFKMARHYLGWAPDAMERIEEHYKGTGADVTKAMKNEGVTFTVAKIWDNVDKNFTERIRTKGLMESCPFCKTPDGIEHDRSKTIEVPEGDTIEITGATKAKVKAVPMPKVIYDDGFVTPDGKWIEVGDYQTHDDVAARMGFKGPGVEPRQAAINAGYVRIVMWDDQGFMMFRDAADAQRRAGAILRHLPVGLERVGIEAGRGKYTEYELAEAEEKFNSGTLKSASAAMKGWYHGTSKENAKKILAEGYLKPGQESIYDVDIPRHNAVYIADYDIAYQYALERGGVVLKVADPNPKNLVPDEDDVYEFLNEKGWNKKGTAISKRVQTHFLNMWNADNAANREGRPPDEQFPEFKNFDECWERWGEVDFEGTAGLSDEMIAFTDYIVKHDPQLAKDIINITGKAAHIGKLKVTGQVKKIATPHDQETFPDGPVDFFEPVENPHTASEKHPDFLYHGTSRKNRESILKNGLLRSMSEASQVAKEQNDPDAGGGIFFHTVLLPNDLNRESIDTWKVNVRGIDLERDFTTEHDESDPWWVSWYQDIPPDRLELVSKTGLSRVSFSILETGRKPMSKSAGYTAYVLTEPARTLLLQTFPPKFPDVIAHHVTMQFGVPAGTPPPPPATVVVEGYASDDSLEAVVVSVNGSTTRPDGGTYHITLSLDRSKGRKPVDSNKVIKEQGWKKVNQPFDIQVEPKTL